MLIPPYHNGQTNEPALVSQLKSPVLIMGAICPAGYVERMTFYCLKMP